MNKYIYIYIYIKNEKIDIIRPEIFKMIKSLHLSDNRFLSTFGLTVYVQEHIMPWVKVNN